MYCRILNVFYVKYKGLPSSWIISVYTLTIAEQRNLKEIKICLVSGIGMILKKQKILSELVPRI